MERKYTLLISACVAIAAIVLTALVIVSTSPSEVQELDMYLAVGDKLGFSVDTDAIYFGIVPPEANGSRPLFIVNDNNLSRRVQITAFGEFADWVTTSENDFIIPAHGNKTIKVYANVPADAEYGDYQGKLRVLFWKVKEPVITGAIAGDVDVEVTPNGRINLTVNDTIGNPVDSASAFVWNATPTLVDSGSTDENGTWLSTYLEAGNYTVEAAKAGYTTESTNVTVTINNTTQAYLTLEPTGAPVLDTSPASIAESVTTGNTAYVILSVLNTGDLTLNDVYLTPSDAWISLGTTYIASITAGSYQNVGVTLGPQPVGTHAGSIFLNSSNDGNVTVPVTLVVSSGVTPGGGGGGPSRPRPELATAIKIVDYPEELSVIRGEPKMFLITVENVGYLKVTNLMLKFERFPGTLEISPMTVDTLDVGRRQVFLVTGEVAEVTPLRDYMIKINASSTEAYDVEEMNLSVVKIINESDKDKLNRTIQELKAVVDAVWEETMEAQNTGLDVDDVFRLLGDSQANLGLGEAFLTEDELDKVREYIEEAKGFLRSSVLELAKTRARGKLVVPTVYIAITLGAVAGLGLLVYKNMRKYERVMRAYRKVEKLERMNIEKRKVVASISTKNRLEKQLALLKEGRDLGYITEAAYQKGKDKLDALLTEIDKKLEEVA